MEENCELRSREPENHQGPHNPNQDIGLTVPIPKEESISAVSASVNSIDGVVRQSPSTKNLLSNEIAMEIESDSTHNSQYIYLSTGKSSSPQKMYLVKNPSSKFTNLTEYLQVITASESHALEDGYLDDHSLFLDSSNKLYILEESSKDSLTKSPHYYFDDTQQDLPEQQMSPFITKTLSGGNRKSTQESNVLDNGIVLCEQYLEKKNSTYDKIKFINSNVSDEKEKYLKIVSGSKICTMDGNINTSASQNYQKKPQIKHEQYLQNQIIPENKLYLRSCAINQTDLLTPKDSVSALDLENSDEFELQSHIDQPTADSDPISIQNAVLDTPNSPGSRIPTYQNDRYYMCDTCVFKSRSIQEITEHVMKFNERGILCTFSEYGDVVDGGYQTNCRIEDDSQRVRFASMVNSSNLKQEQDITEERDNFELISNLRLKTNLYPETLFPIQYQCNICPYICNLENDLRLHILKHTIPKTNLGKYNWKCNNNSKYLSLNCKLDKSNICAVQDKNIIKQETSSNIVTIRKNNVKKNIYKSPMYNFKSSKKSSIEKQKLSKKIEKTFKCNTNECVNSKNCTINKSLLTRSKTKSYFCKFSKDDK